MPINDQAVERAGPASGPPQASPPPAPPASRARGRWPLYAVALVFGLLIAAVLAVLGTAWYLLRSEAGTAWLLARVPGVEVTAPHGALLGERFGAKHLRVTWAAGAAKAEIDDLELAGAQWRVWPGPGVWASLKANQLSARRVLIVNGPSSGEPVKEPATLRLPLELVLQQVTVSELQIDKLEPVRELAARVLVGADGGRQHRIEKLQFGWDRLQAGADVAIGADAPFRVDALARAQGTSGMAWQAEVRAQGPLATVDVSATLRGLPPASASKQAAPSADVQVALRPFAAWPLGTLEARTRALDLSALMSNAPATRIDGHVTVTSRGAASPVEAEIELDNKLPGRWDQARVPLQALRLTLRANPAKPSRVELPAFEFRFADAQGAAGQWQGEGSWDGHEAKISSRVIDLQPLRLDARAAAMRLSGPLDFAFRKLPSPDPNALPAPKGSATGSTKGLEAIEADLRGTLQGSVEGAPQNVTLALDATGSMQDIQLRTLRATAGDATAQGSARLQLRDTKRWQLQTNGQLARFDPAAWFPGPAGTPWRRGPHRLSGSWNFDLALPDSAVRRPPLEWLRAMQGNGELRLNDSLLAGVATQGWLKLQHDAAAAPAQRSRASGELQLGTNRVTLEGRGDPLGDGGSDHWQAELRAAALPELAPLFALHPALAAWQPRKGSLEASASADGRWPALRTEGKVKLLAVQSGELAIESTAGTWRIDTGASKQVDVQIEGSQVVFGTQRVESLRADVRGTLAAHQLSLAIAAPLQPPPVLTQALGLRAGAGTQLQLQGKGGWTAEAANTATASGAGPAAGSLAGIWRGEFQKLAAGVWERGTAAPPDASWLDAGGLKAEIRLDANGRPLAFAAPAGRATLAGNMVLLWRDIQWRGDAQQPELALQAEIEPVAVAPILVRMQEASGRSTQQWAGDLRVSAKVDVRAGERFEANIVLQRSDGDLSYTDVGSAQWLGLTDARFELLAKDGVWRFTPTFAGRMLGIVTGAVTARTTPQARWPEPKAALEGALTAQVPRLSAWAGWLPPGWRIEGELTTTAGVSGTVGAPAYTGDLRATGLGLRNLLQGVAVSDGEINAVLEGETARIEKFSLRGGDGTLTATGNANFGAKPQAQLAVKAEKFRVLGRIDRQLIVSGQAAMTLQPDKLKLDGRLGVDSGLIDISRSDAPSLDSDVTVLRDAKPAAAAAEPAPVSAAMRNAAVSLEIDLGDKIRLRGRGLDSTLAGQLKLTAPGGRLAVDGTVRAENGTYAAYGQKMSIERGRVILAGPIDGARLDILALRKDVDTRVGVLITGTALNPRVRLYSEPDMSDTDKLSWLVLGRGPDGLGRTDTALLQRAAIALLSGEGEGPTDNLIRSIGLDELSLRQSDGEVRETVISLGKQISQRWYVGYEHGVNATAGTWQLIYRIAQRFTLRAQSGLDNSLDVIWTWRFGGP